MTRWEEQFKALIASWNKVKGILEKDNFLETDNPEILRMHKMVHRVDSLLKTMEPIIDVTPLSGLTNANSYVNPLLNELNQFLRSNNSGNIQNAIVN